MFDYNRDDVISGAEIARGSVSDVYPPTATYTDRHTVTLGGKRVTMTYLGVAHADDSSVLHFPDERAVFSADILQVKRLPGGLAPTVGVVDRRAVDHQRARLRARADRPRACLARRRTRRSRCSTCEDISKGVAAGIAAGRSLPEIQKTLTLDAYKGFERWDTIREAHIAAVYATIKGTRPATGAR